MSKSFKFTLTMLAIFTLSTLLALPLYDVLFPYFKFEKIFNRLIMIFSVTAAAIFVLMSKANQEKRLSKPAVWKEYGFDFSAPWRRLWVRGFLIGVVLIVLIVAVEIAFGPQYLRRPVLLQDVIERFFKGMLSGIAIGIIEEFFFRGFVFTWLKQRMNLWVAIFLASGFYSLTHFFDNGQIFIPSDPSVGDALRLLLGYLEPLFIRPFDILPEFFGLFLFGILLNLVFVRTHTLFTSIGIHAGAVFVIKFQYSFVRKGPDLYDAWFGRAPCYDGVFEWLLLVILGCVILCAIFPREHFQKHL